MAGSPAGRENCTSTQRRLISPEQLHRPKSVISEVAIRRLSRFRASMARDHETRRAPTQRSVFETSRDVRGLVSDHGHLGWALAFHRFA
jgi:hypothetical protein